MLRYIVLVSLFLLLTGCVGGLRSRTSETTTKKVVIEGPGADLRYCLEREAEIRVTDSAEADAFLKECVVMAEGRSLEELRQAEEGHKRVALVADGLLGVKGETAVVFEPEDKEVEVVSCDEEPGCLTGTQSGSQVWAMRVNIQQMKDDAGCIRRTGYDGHPWKLQISEDGAFVRLLVQGVQKGPVITEPGVYDIKYALLGLDEFVSIQKVELAESEAWGKGFPEADE